MRGHVLSLFVTAIFASLLLCSDASGSFTVDEFFTHANKWKRLLILTEGRSGSSFVAELLDHSPEIFYVGEPEVDPWMFNDIYQCLFTLDEAFLRRAMWLCGRSKECSKVLVSEHWQIMANQAISSHQQLQLLDLCANRHRLIKYIRPVPAQDLSTFISSLYIIHLIRDPRAVINSRLNAHWINPDQIRSESTALCRLIEDKMRLGVVAGNVSSKYQIFRYGDLAKDPYSFATSLYRFVGLLPPDTLPGMISEHFNKTVDRKEDPYSTFRFSPADSLDVWQKEMSKEQIAIVEKECYNVIKAMGEQFIARN